MLNFENHSFISDFTVFRYFKQFLCYMFSMQLYYIQKESQPTSYTIHLFIYSQISNMFQSDLLDNFGVSHAAMFQCRKKSRVVTTVVVFIGIQIIKIRLQLKYIWNTIKIQLNTK